MLRTSYLERIGSYNRKKKLFEDQDLFASDRSKQDLSFARAALQLRQARQIAHRQGTTADQVRR